VKNGSEALKWFESAKIMEGVSDKDKAIIASNIAILKKMNEMEQENIPLSNAND
jgi:hypothetical protein